jgi:hypothetical protein
VARARSPSGGSIHIVGALWRSITVGAAAGGIAEPIMSGTIAGLGRSIRRTLRRGAS